MHDYIDPWLGLWVAIFLWGFWFYLVVKAAKQKRVKISITEDIHGFKDVTVYRMEKGEWLIISRSVLEPTESVSEHVKRVIGTR